MDDVIELQLQEEKDKNLLKALGLQVHVFMQCFYEIVIFFILETAISYRKTLKLFQVLCRGSSNE